ncbi:MAG: hypothetical protein IPK94_01350 [Saprospiraceae bacterium]|nr:hypothetical protein [Saprospiraceae bacterium]
MKTSTVKLLVVFLISTATLWSQADIQYSRPWNRDGINVFEPSKTADQPKYDGFKTRIGGSFTQDFQSLTHSNTPGNNDKNLLYGVIKSESATEAPLKGFNLAMANLNLDFQIDDGIRVALENYMSSRHHSEFWVKGGYVQIDKLPMFGSPQWFTDYVRVKIGHFTPNFGDIHFKRTDGGNAMFNPYVENLILDAFATEIGSEIYVFPTKNLMAMVGMTSGLINGNVENYPDANNSSGVVPTKKTPSIFAKVAFDKSMEDFRFRLSASIYSNSNIQRNTLYAGDRTGSHYFLVMEPALQSNGTATTQAAQMTSGRFNPDMPNRINAIMINPFVKFKGLELMGSYETLKGSNYADVKEGKWLKREFTQTMIEANYRFLPEEQMYVGVRNIGMTGEPRGVLNNGAQAKVKVNRTAFVAGWFATKNLLLKAEVVSQKFKDFPSTDYRNNGKFNGFVIEAVVGL